MANAQVTRHGVAGGAVLVVLALATRTGPFIPWLPAAPFAPWAP